MARHREVTAWNPSRARHRGPGSVERFAQRGRHAFIASLASLLLVTALVAWDPVFEHRI